jgi:hypothetical protein
MVQWVVVVVVVVVVVDNPYQMLPLKLLVWRDSNNTGMLVSSVGKFTIVLEAPAKAFDATEVSFGSKESTKMPRQLENASAGYQHPWCGKREREKGT